MYWLLKPRINLNANVNIRYWTTLNRQSQGHVHKWMPYFNGSHQGLHVYANKVLCLYWLPLPTTNLNAKVSLSYSMTLKGKKPRPRSQVRVMFCIINLLFMYYPTYKHGKLHKINADKALYRIQIHRNCIEIHQNDPSPKRRPKRVKN